MKRKQKLEEIKKAIAIVQGLVDPAIDTARHKTADLSDKQHFDALLDISGDVDNAMFEVEKALEAHDDDDHDPEDAARSDHDEHGIWNKSQTGVQ